MDTSAELVALVGVGILLTALFLQSESFVGPLVRGIALQSLFIGLLLGWLAWSQRSVDLALLAVLAVGVRAVFIPWVLDRQIRAFRWRLRGSCKTVLPDRSIRETNYPRSIRSPRTSWHFTPCLPIFRPMGRMPS